MTASDGGGKSAEGVLTVTVNRNLNAPMFAAPAQYSAEIKDNEPLMSSIVRVTADDKDEQVRFLYIVQIGMMLDIVTIFLNVTSTARE